MEATPAVGFIGLGAMGKARSTIHLACTLPPSPPTLLPPPRQLLASLVFTTDRIPSCGPSCGF